MTSTFRQAFPDACCIVLLTFNVAISLILKMVSYIVLYDLFCLYNLF